MMPHLSIIYYVKFIKKLNEFEKTGRFLQHAPEAGPFRRGMLLHVHMPTHAQKYLEGD